MAKHIISVSELPHDAATGDTVVMGGVLYVYDENEGWVAAEAGGGGGGGGGFVQVSSPSEMETGLSTIELRAGYVTAVVLDQDLEVSIDESTPEEDRNSYEAILIAMQNPPGGHAITMSSSSVMTAGGVQPGIDTTQGTATTLTFRRVMAVGSWALTDVQTGLSPIP